MIGGIAIGVFWILASLGWIPLLVLFCWDIVRRREGALPWQAFWWLSWLLMGVAAVLPGLPFSNQNPSAAVMWAMGSLMLLPLAALGSSTTAIVLGLARWLRLGQDGARKMDTVGIASGFAISASFLLSPVLPDYGFRAWLVPYLPVLPAGFVVSLWAFVEGGVGSRIEATRPLTAGWMAVVPLCMLGWALAFSGLRFFQGVSLTWVVLVSIAPALIAAATLAAILRIEPRCRWGPVVGMCLLIVFGALGLLGQWHAWTSLLEDIDLPGDVGRHVDELKDASLDCISVGTQRKLRGPCINTASPPRALTADTSASELSPGDTVLIGDGRAALNLSTDTPTVTGIWEDSGRFSIVSLEPVKHRTDSWDDPDVITTDATEVVGIPVRGTLVKDVVGLCTRWKAQCTVLDGNTYP